MKATKLGLAVIAATLAAAGCGPAIELNRVGPNVVEKAIFQGEWHYRSTVIDKQYHTSGTFIGLEGGLERVRWEVTENALVAHRSYEKIPGSDPSNPGDNNVVAAFPIAKHFDIRRGYNSVNGVENNVIEENDSDRPWWERDYMRVDWSLNIGPSFDQAAGDIRCWQDEYGVQCSVGGMTGINRNANNDPKYPYKVRISSDYLETTVDTQELPNPYVCYLLDGMSPCNAAMVKMKLSFKKIDQANDYVPLDYPDYSEVATGILVRDDNGEGIAASVKYNGQFVERMCVNDEVGPDGKGIFLVIEDGDTTRMCNTDPFDGDDLTDCQEIVGRCDGMEELWFSGGPEDVGLPCDTSVVDPDSCYQFTLPIFSRFGYFRTDRYVQDRENGFTLHGRERLINRWNIWQSSRTEDGALIPMAARDPKPVVYYLNVTFPPEMLSSADALEADWDVAFRGAVASAKGVPLSAITQQMFDIRINDCNIARVNSVAAELDLEVALRDNGIDEVAIGNLENACAVLEHETQKLHLADPSVAVFTWQQLGDLRYSFLNWTPKPELAGPLGYGPSAADPITGEIISANANMYGASLDTYANWAADIVQLINGEITTEDVMNGTNVREHIEAVRNRWSQATPKTEINAFKELFNQRTAFMSDEQYFKQIPVTAVNEGMDRLARSGIEETFLIDDEMLRLFGGDPTAISEGRVTSEMMANARPSSWARQRVPQEALVAANASSAAALDGEFVATPANMLGAASKLDELSDYLGRQNFCFLAQQVEPAVADLAVRLKDEGLTREQMVQRVREQIFIGVAAHELGHTFGLRHNFSGSADAVNFFPEFWGVTDLPEEQQHLHARNGMSNRYETAYSSIMDYHQRFNSDWAGIGLYDKAAIKMGYAEMAEVFDESEGLFVARDWITSATFLFDPYDLPLFVGGATANSRIDDEYNRTLDQYLAGDENAVMDIANDTGIVPRAENIFRRRDVPLRDYMRNEVYRAYVGAITDKNTLAQYGLLDDDGNAPKVGVPYDFCSDAYAWGGGLTCNRWDMGITSSEIVNNAGEMYEFYYPFNNFRRDRVTSYGSWVNGYLSRLYSRTYQPMLNSFRYFYYYRRSSLRLFPGVNDWGAASLKGMNFFARVLQTPEPGTYCKSGATYVPEAKASDCRDSLELGLDQGRIYNTSWDTEYIYNPSNLGVYWDKAIAIQAMTDSDAFFFRDFSSYTNRGAFSIGYYRVFQPEMLSLFGGLMGGDTSKYAPVVVNGADGAEVVYRPFLTTDAYGNVVTPDPRLTAGDPIEPASSYQLKHWAAVFGMFNLTSTLDQTMDFAARARIRLAGSASDPVVDTSVVDPANIAAFTDPVSGIVYRSVAVDGPEVSIGFNLLDNAQDFVDGQWSVAKAALEAARVGGDAATIRAAEVEFLTKEAELNDRVQIIDFMVLLGDYMEFPG